LVNAGTLFRGFLFSNPFHHYIAQISFLKESKFPLIAVSWFLFVTFLLCLPGSEFPKVSWLTKIWIDKWIHIVLFFLLVFLWSRSWWSRNKETTNLKSIFLWIAVSGLLYGIIMELVQHLFIPFRSFETGDIIADGLGSFGGYWFSTRRYIKK